MAGGLVSLGMIGGFLHQKTPEIVSEYLPVAKMLDGGGGMGGILKKVVQGGGLQSIMSNPLGAITGQLQGTIGQGVASLSGVAGAGSLVSSLSGPGGLASAASSLLGSSGGLLSGQGVLNILSHSSMAGLLGDALPSSMSLDNVLRPLFSDGMLSHVDLSVGSLVSSVVSGSLGGDAAAGQVQAYTSAIMSVVDGSSQALSSMSGSSPPGFTSGLATEISAVHALASVMASATTSSAPQIVVDALSRGLGADLIQQMVDSVATH